MKNRPVIPSPLRMLRLPSLRLRTQLVLLGAVAVFIAAISFYLYTIKQQRRLFEREFSKSTLATLEAVRLGLEVGLDQENYENISKVLNWAKKEPTVRFIALTDSSGGIIAVYPETLAVTSQQLMAFPSILARENPVFVRSGEWQSKSFGKSKLYIGFSTEYMRKLDQRALRDTGMASFLFLVVSAAGALVVALSITRPLERLREVTERIANQDLESRADEEQGSEEVISVARAFNKMIRQLLDAQRAEQALMQEMEKELQTAHEMQMGLMPKERPQIKGFDIAGRCTPANHVGGDLFQYFYLPQDRLAISMADVTGHAMAAAIPVVMFNGILESQMELGGSIEELFGRLNRSLHRTLTGHTFVCFAMGELNPTTRTFLVSNSGCPYPYHYRAATGVVVELQVDAYPLGVRPDTAYQTIEVQLEPGDRVVFCSDGIIEATNAGGEMFGFERTGEVIRRGCGEDLSAEALLERIVQEVRAFSGEVPQGDDQTVVVVKVA